jgi:hypothetical protein
MQPLGFAAELFLADLIFDVIELLYLGDRLGSAVRIGILRLKPVFAPASASFSTAMICSSLNRFAFVVRSHVADSTPSPYYSRGSPQ